MRWSSSVATRPRKFISSSLAKSTLKFHLSLESYFSTLWTQAHACAFTPHSTRTSGRNLISAARKFAMWRRSRQQTSSYWKKNSWICPMSWKLSAPKLRKTRKPVLTSSATRIRSFQAWLRRAELPFGAKCALRFCAFHANSGSIGLSWCLKVFKT